MQWKLNTLLLTLTVTRVGLIDTYLLYYCVLRKYFFQCIIAALEKLLRKFNISFIFLEFPTEIVLPLNCVEVFSFSQLYTTWKVSVYGVFLVRIFPHSDWIRRDTEYSVGMRENTDQENSEYRHFLWCHILFSNLKTNQVAGKGDSLQNNFAITLNPRRFFNFLLSNPLVSSSFSYFYRKLLLPPDIFTGNCWKISEISLLPPDIYLFKVNNMETPEQCLTSVQN